MLQRLIRKIIVAANSFMPLPRFQKQSRAELMKEKELATLPKVSNLTDETVGYSAWVERKS